MSPSGHVLADFHLFAAFHNVIVRDRTVYIVREGKLIEREQ